MKNLIKLILSIVPMVFITQMNMAQEINPSVLRTNVGNRQLVNDALLNRKMTSFNPAIHGFRFVNDFQQEITVAGVNGPRFGGLCGGMSYAMLDYYFTKNPTPQQTFRPATGTKLQQYIANRQNKSVIDNADKWLELINNPFGWRTNEFFNWGLQGFNGGRLEELKKFIDAGKPVPLGLFEAGDGGFKPHHQVIAIGYQLGKYKGDLKDHKEDFKIFICDPNFPQQIMTLVPNLADNSFYYVEDKRCKWMTYFVDKKYKSSAPPFVQAPTTGPNGMVKELLVEIRTGGDDLRGGNDNVNMIVKLIDGTTQTFPNINKAARWINNYTETVSVKLKPEVALNKIKSISFITTFGGGIGGDNWNVDALRILARDGAGDREIYSQSAKPLVRFDGNNTPFVASIAQ